MFRFMTSFDPAVNTAPAAVEAVASPPPDNDNEEHSAHQTEQQQLAEIAVKISRTVNRVVLPALESALLVAPPSEHYSDDVVAAVADFWTPTTPVPFAHMRRNSHSMIVLQEQVRLWPTLRPNFAMLLRLLNNNSEAVVRCVCDIFKRHVVREHRADLDAVRWITLAAEYASVAALFLFTKQCLCRFAEPRCDEQQLGNLARLLRYLYQQRGSTLQIEAEVAVQLLLTSDRDDESLGCVRCMLHRRSS